MMKRTLIPIFFVLFTCFNIYGATADRAEGEAVDHSNPVVGEAREVTDNWLASRLSSRAAARADERADSQDVPDKSEPVVIQSADDGIGGDKGEKANEANTPKSSKAAASAATIAVKTADTKNRSASAIDTMEGIRLNDGELEILARVIYSEARGESFEGQVAVGAVVLNRVLSPRFPDTIKAVVFQKGAFTALRDGQYRLAPDSIAYAAALEALKGVDPTGEAIYYYNPKIATSDWIRTRLQTAEIGNHIFAR
ncbi:cell wall hydrolase [Gorillibacterium massiliense]|uniref:cell wall hydrolase n=1 Tax=Gorillibacterium massiliense TaxID=1280390 RepID=UPI0004B15218|nr:cell wall hydrolase [Gorillibacterium massiliense]